MNRIYKQFKKQDLLDKLSELASLLSAGRRVDPNASYIKNQLEAIQIEIQSRNTLTGSQRLDTNER